MEVADGMQSLWTAMAQANERIQFAGGPAAHSHIASPGKTVGAPGQLASQTPAADRLGRRGLRHAIQFDRRRYRPTIRPVPEEDLNDWKKLLVQAPPVRNEEDLRVMELAICREGSTKLENFPLDIRLGLLRRATLASIPKGDVLIEQGEIGNEFYVLLSGLVLV